MKATEIQFVDSDGQDGCGFICDQYFEKLLDGCGFAKLTMSIYVWLYSKQHGIFKDMITRKHIISGPRIQLNNRLLKVIPSYDCTDCHQEAITLFVKIGIYPKLTNKQFFPMVNHHAIRDATKDFK